MHNKKRNTKFLFEIILREWATSLMSKNNENIVKVQNILKEFFNKDSLLMKEVQYFNDVLELTEKKDFFRILQEIKTSYSKLDQKEIYNIQTKLLFELNNNFGKDIFNYFIPKYQLIGSIKQIFDSNTLAETKIKLENKLEEILTHKQEAELEITDSIVYKKFVERYNSEYKQLLPEQKNLINKYIYAFENDGIDLAISLNEEVSRLKNELTKLEKDCSDERRNKINSVLSLLEDWKGKKIKQHEFIKILKIQKLVNEIQNEE